MNSVNYVFSLDLSEIQSITEMNAKPPGNYSHDSHGFQWLSVHIQGFLHHVNSALSSGLFLICPNAFLKPGSRSIGTKWAKFLICALICSQMALYFHLLTRDVFHCPNTSGTLNMTFMSSSVELFY